MVFIFLSRLIYVRLSDQAHLLYGVSFPDICFGTVSYLGFILNQRYSEHIRILMEWRLMLGDSL